MNWVQVAVTALTATGVGGGIGYLIRWKWFGGKRQADVTSTVEITGTAVSLVNQLDDLYKGALAEAREARVEARTAQAEADAAKDESRQCKADHDQLRREFDQFKRDMGNAVREEASWAVQVRDALLAQKWPEGVSQKPPILAYVPA